MSNLRAAYRGGLFLEVMLLAGVNDSEQELAGLRAAVEKIHPDRVQLNTVVRPPADARALALDRGSLERIREYFGEKAEIVADVPIEGRGKEAASHIRSVLDMAGRRPLRKKDMARALGLPAEAVEDLVKGLLIKGFLREKQHGGEAYYVGREKEV